MNPLRKSKLTYKYTINGCMHATEKPSHSLK